jgi:tetratricopeptide (TPR) repeat protein
MKLFQTTLKSMVLAFAAIIAVMVAVPVSSVFAQDLKAACAKIDDLLEDGKVNEAKKVLDESYSVGSKDYEWTWRSSRIHLLMGDMTGDAAKKEGFYYEARRLADEAIKMNGNGMMGYLRRSAASGKVALVKSVIGAADMVKSSREDAQKAISLNNTTPQNLASAYYILGRMHLKLTETAKAKRMMVGLGWGNLDEALSNLKRANELRPDFIMIPLEYGKALAANNQFNEARQQLQRVAGLKVGEYGDDNRKKEAAEVLASIQGK